MSSGVPRTSACATHTLIVVYPFTSRICVSRRHNMHLHDLCVCPSARQLTCAYFQVFLCPPVCCSGGGEALLLGCGGRFADSSRCIKKGKGKGEGILVLRRSTNGHFYPILCSRWCTEYTLPSCQAMSTLYRG